MPLILATVNISKQIKLGLNFETKRPGLLEIVYPLVGTFSMGAYKRVG